MPSKTPILDLEAPLPQRAKHWQTDLSWRQIFLVLSGLLVLVPGIAALLFAHPNRFILALLEAMGRWFPLGKVLDSINPYLLPPFLLAFLAACFLPVAVHEVAHALAGALVGFRPENLVMGPLRVGLHGGKLRFRPARRGGPNGCCNVSIPTVVRLHRKFFSHVGAAPLANLVTGASVIAGWRLGVFGWAPVSLVVLVLGFGYVSVIAGIANLVPAQHRSGLYSDGARLRMLATNSPECRRWLSITALQIQLARGKSFKDLNRRWLRNGCYLDDGSSDALTARWLAYLSTQADDNEAVAAADLEACLQNAGAASLEFVDRLRAAASVFHALRTRDAARAERWFSEIRSPKSLPRLVEIRTSVALRAVQGRKEEALLKWDEGMTVIKSLPSGPRERLERSWMKWKEEILRQCAHAEKPAQPGPARPAQ